MRKYTSSRDDHSKDFTSHSQKIVCAYQNLYSIGYDAVEWVSSVYLPRINFGMDEVTIREVIVNQYNEVNEQNDLACWAYSIFVPCLVSNSVG